MTMLWLKLTPTYLEKRIQPSMAKKVHLHHLEKNWRKQENNRPDCLQHNNECCRKLYVWKRLL